MAPGNAETWRVDLLADVDEWTALSGLSETTLGKHAVGQSSFVAGLRMGKGVTVARYLRFRDHLEQDIARLKREDAPASAPT